MNGPLIAACATHPGPGGVAIIRISGDGVYPLVDQIVTTPERPSQRPEQTFFHTTIIDPANEAALDDALVLLFRAPHSYTGEDTIELQCHGGTVTATRILELLYRLGAAPAAPGEFTKRAFLNGRLDLTQAEAVCDIIQARTTRAASAAHEQLTGKLSRTLLPLYESTLHLGAQVEHLLDFDEGELPERFEQEATQRLDRLHHDIQALLATWHQGRLLREGALVVIAGRPNAGKSSLLNLLLGFDRAIVNAQAGTTRDAIEETLDLDGIPVTLVDTAGLREADCEIEREGIQRARNKIAQADLLLYLIDASNPEPRPTGNPLVVYTKTDLAPHPLDVEEYCFISILKDPDGARLTICKAIKQRLLQSDTSGDTAYVVDARHYSELTQCAQALTTAQTLFQQGAMGYVPAADQLRTAAEALGRILGKTYTTDLLDRIFSTFCVGK